MTPAPAAGARREGGKQQEPGGLLLRNSLAPGSLQEFVPRSGRTVLWYNCGPTVYNSSHVGHARNYLAFDVIRRVLEGYFEYRVVLVMNVTDVDDKIIKRARQNALLQQYEEAPRQPAEVAETVLRALDRLIASLEAKLEELEAKLAAAQQAPSPRQQQPAASQSRAEASAAHPPPPQPAPAAGSAAAAAGAGTGADGAASAREPAPSAAGRGAGGSDPKPSEREPSGRREGGAASGLRGVSREAAALAARASEEALRLQRHRESRAAVERVAADASLGDAERVAALVTEGRDALAEELDAMHGHTVTDHAIFRRHAEKYLKEFWDDMEALGCRKPEAAPRVSESIPEIVAYVQRILDNGFAYAADSGSVYFDTAAFRAAGFTYGKLCPVAISSAAGSELATEGEANFATREKRSPGDFALWKAAKPGEPSWASPWGPGRPGWHIECSAMASAHFYPQGAAESPEGGGGAAQHSIDIHSGGEDLKFPHHDNEIAQAEAYYHCGGVGSSSAHAAQENGGGHAAPQGEWVRYWLHTGHLHIEGRKMSKSLKNFITIREALQTHRARTVRLLFASSPWDAQVMFSADSLAAAADVELTLFNFFDAVETLLRDGAGAAAGSPPGGPSGGAQLPSPRAQEGAAHANGGAPHYQEQPTQAKVDRSLSAALSEAQAEVDACLRRNINTPGALAALLELLRAFHKAKQAPAAQARDLALFVTRILRVIGLSQAREGEIGFGGAEEAAAAREEAAPVLDRLAAYRETIRGHAIALAKGGGSGSVEAVAAAARLQASQDAAQPDDPRPSRRADLAGAYTGFVGDVAAAVTEGHEAVPAAATGQRLLALCDRVRDKVLPALGVRLADRPGLGPAWSLVDPALLAAEAARAEREAREAQRRPLLAAKEKAEKELGYLEAERKRGRPKQGAGKKKKGRESYWDLLDGGAADPLGAARSRVGEAIGRVLPLSTEAQQAELRARLEELGLS